MAYFLIRIWPDDVLRARAVRCGVIARARAQLVIMVCARTARVHTRSGGKGARSWKKRSAWRTLTAELVNITGRAAEISKLHSLRLLVTTSTLCLTPGVQRCWRVRLDRPSASFLVSSWLVWSCLIFFAGSFLSTWIWKILLCTVDPLGATLDTPWTFTIRRRTGARELHRNFEWYSSLVYIQWLVLWFGMMDNLQQLSLVKMHASYASCTRNEHFSN